MILFHGEIVNDKTLMILKQFKGLENKKNISSKSNSITVMLGNQDRRTRETGKRIQSDIDKTNDGIKWYRNYTAGRYILITTMLFILQNDDMYKFRSGPSFAHAFNSYGVQSLKRIIQTSNTSSKLISRQPLIIRRRMSTTTTHNSNTSRENSPSVTSSPIVVSEQAEALSHSKTTMKLIPSYELFQILPNEEGGITPGQKSGNVMRDSNILKVTFSSRGGVDTLANTKLSDFVGLGGTKKIESTLPDPFKLVEKELKPFSDSISELVSTDQPILSMAAKHFFEKRQGKRFRPTIVQLVAKAIAVAEPEPRPNHLVENMKDVDLTDWEWSGASTIDIEGGKITSTNHQGSEVWRKQAQLGQIVEMIHVASLIHDDVLDEADTRRGGESVHKLYSNKVAVLAGDYLLARASVLLARLENTAVVQIMATALESLVAGEIMQLKSPPESLLEMSTYLRKSYYKTASLICYACRSTALLGGHAYGSTVATACEEFGFHLGLAYQIHDDILDFTAAATVLGKPALADMDLGLSTAPILYAAQEFKELRPLVMRRFKEQWDKQTALEYLYKSKTAMDKARNLARFHAQRAVDALLRLPQSDGRDALVRLTHSVITRSK